jgi:hypothetical protein
MTSLITSTGLGTSTGTGGREGRGPWAGRGKDAALSCLARRPPQGRRGLAAGWPAPRAEPPDAVAPQGRLRAARAARRRCLSSPGTGTGTGTGTLTSLTTSTGTSTGTGTGVGTSTFTSCGAGRGEGGEAGRGEAACGDASEGCAAPGSKGSHDCLGGCNRPRCHPLAPGPLPPHLDDLHGHGHGHGRRHGHLHLLQGAAVVRAGKRRGSSGVR